MAMAAPAPCAASGNGRNVSLLPRTGGLGSACLAALIAPRRALRLPPAPGADGPGAGPPPSQPLETPFPVCVRNPGPCFLEMGSAGVGAGKGAGWRMAVQQAELPAIHTPAEVAGAAGVGEAFEDAKEPRSEDASVPLSCAGVSIPPGWGLPLSSPETFPGGLVCCCPPLPPALEISSRGGEGKGWGRWLYRTPSPRPKPCMLPKGQGSGWGRHGGLPGGAGEGVGGGGEQ